MDTVPLDSIDVNKLEFREMAPEDADAVEIVEKACFAIPWSRESFWKEAAGFPMRKRRLPMWRFCLNIGASALARGCLVRLSTG